MSEPTTTTETVTIPGNLLEGIDGYYTSLSETLKSMYQMIYVADQYLRDIELSNSPVYEYLGYARYVMGDVLYMGFTGACLIMLIITISKFTIDYVSKIKTMCGL